MSDDLLPMDVFLDSWIDLCPCDFFWQHLESLQPLPQLLGAEAVAAVAAPHLQVHAWNLDSDHWDPSVSNVHAAKAHSQSLVYLALPAHLCHLENPKSNWDHLISSLCDLLGRSIPTKTYSTCLAGNAAHVQHHFLGLCQSKQI